MLKTAYDDGLRQALRDYGVLKDDEDKGEESHALRNTLVAGAAASPFLGMIGQKPLLHDAITNPNIPRYRSMAELARQARPGDVLLTTKPGGSMWKTFISPTSGSEFYHSEAVAGQSKGKGTTVSAGQFDDPEFRQMSPKQLKRQMDPIGREFAQEYPDVMLMRPKNITPAQAQTFSQEALARGVHPYSKGKAVETWLREIFQPKLKAFEGGAAPQVCEGNVCSTLPAMAYDKAGINVVPGKRPQDIFPPDFLRSENFTPVGARLKNQYYMNPSLRKALPYLTRAGLGAGLAAGVYGLSQDPALAAVPLGLMGGGMLASHLSNKLTGKTLPNTFEFLNELPGLEGSARGNLIRGFAGKRLPAMLAGAAASYLGGKGVQHLMSSLG